MNVEGTSSKGLSGLRVMVFESRMSPTLTQLVRLQGGEPFAAPLLKEVPIERNQEAFAFGEALLAGKIDLLILLTGVGTRALVRVLETRHDRERILSALRSTPVLPRGPKPIKALDEIKVPYVDTVPEPNTWRELMATLDKREEDIPLKGRLVAVQEYGARNHELIEALQERGATVFAVPVYRWELPDDLGPAREAVRRIIRGQADVALFTTAVHIDHLCRIAAEMGVEEQLRAAFEKIVIASVGPDTSEALRAKGLWPDLEPSSPKMGPLVAETALRAVAVLEQKRRHGCGVEVRDAILDLAVEPVPAYEDGPFLRACRRQPVPHTPVWLMRQAGRYQASYRAVRKERTFLELCKSPELACQVTVQAQEDLGTDAAIIFADILLILEPLGTGLEYSKGDGPVVPHPVRRRADVGRLKSVRPEESLAYVMEAIHLTRRRLRPEVPLIGFAGAPFTLAAYMIEGGSSKDFVRVRRFIREEPEAWAELMERLVEATGAYLSAQVRAGAQVLQIFDSWVGCLTRDEYVRSVQPHTARLFGRINGLAPNIHFGTGTAHLLDLLAQAGGDVVGADHRIALDEAWTRIGHDRAVQGNLDPEALLGPKESLRQRVQAVLERAAGRPGHIFNLGHGILQTTPEENAREVVRLVHELSAR
ncbi:MAG: Uroporphyrinogen decarboxylase [Candidatus Omnitrophica bacterium]|nr:Uroporphyrinogen decarboxylase [Candidatus Omnitrophota bacterium]